MISNIERLKVLKNYFTLSSIWIIHHDIFGPSDLERTSNPIITLLYHTLIKWILSEIYFKNKNKIKNEAQHWKQKIFTSILYT